MTPVTDLNLEQEARQVGQEALTVVQQATGIAVIDIASRNHASELGRIVAGLDKQAKEKFDAIKEPLNRAKDEIMAWEHSVRDPLATAKAYLSKQIGTFDAEQERLRIIEQKRLQAEEDARVARENEENQKRAKEEAARISQEQAIADALELTAAGDHAGAEAVLNNPVPTEVYVEPVFAQPVIVAKIVPKSEGVSTATNWTFQITDEALIPREYLMVDEKKIRQIVKALKNKTNIPGVRAYPDPGARFRA